VARVDDECEEGAAANMKPRTSTKDALKNLPWRAIASVAWMVVVYAFFISQYAEKILEKLRM